MSHLQTSFDHLPKHNIIKFLFLFLLKLADQLQFLTLNSHNFLLDSLQAFFFFLKNCIADRKNEIYWKKCYLNHGESKAVFGNNDTPIGRNDSTCRNVFKWFQTCCSPYRLYRQQAYILPPPPMDCIVNSKRHQLLEDYCFEALSLAFWASPFWFFGGWRWRG